MAASDADKKTMDIAKPGKTAPDASARPVIVTHRPMVQDPMVKTDEAASELVATDKPAVKSKTTMSDKVIEPSAELSQEALGEEVEEAPEAEKDETEQAETKPAEDDSTAKPEPKTDAKTDEKTTSDKSGSPSPQPKQPDNSSDTAAVDAVAEQAAESRKKDEKSEQDAAQQARIAKLIENKQYFVKTGQVARRRNNRIAIVFLVLILAVVGLYLAVDAGALKPGFDVPVHIIKR